MKVLITGADGFIGKNLRLVLRERSDVQVEAFTRENCVEELPHLLEGVDFVFHLAGINRPQDTSEFYLGNADLTQALAQAVGAKTCAGNKAPGIVFTSSAQASRENDYGKSKRLGEEALRSLALDTKAPIHVFRLPNVFGKWCKPNYNSAVATFCHNIARDLPIQVNDPSAALTLVYVDDVVRHFVQLMDGATVAVNSEGFSEVHPQYATTVGELAEQIQAFSASRQSLITERVGTGLVRALYSTYVSYLPPERFAYEVPKYGDARGMFVEMLKTPDSGQFSFFTAHPGITRGGHYHHSKTEKFLVIKGSAQFKFRQMETGETYALDTSGDKPEIVETVPGWTHDITNIGKEEMIVMLWANEIFDRANPDTFACPL